MSVRVHSLATWCLPEATCNTMPFSAVGGPVPEQARQGRDQQRYGVSGERLVAGCIPVRTQGPDASQAQVMLITSRGGKGWVFPKGGWEQDEVLEAAALRETLEEAGVRGSIEEPLLGTFAFQSGKQERLHNVHQGRCTAHMFIMHVAEELELWPECGERERAWMPLGEAYQKCRHQWMRDALRAWICRQGWEEVLEGQVLVSRTGSSLSDSST